MKLFGRNTHAVFNCRKFCNSVIERIKFVFVDIARPYIFKHIAEIRLSVFNRLYLQSVFARFGNSGIVARYKVVPRIVGHNVLFYFCAVCPQIETFKLRFGRPSDYVYTLYAENRSLKKRNLVALFGHIAFKIKHISTCITLRFNRYSIISRSGYIEKPFCIRYPLTVVYAVKITSCICVTLPYKSHRMRFRISFNDWFCRCSEFYRGKTKFTRFYHFFAHIGLNRNRILPRFRYNFKQIKFILV